jgi:CubicO group peptidase (beta-lactamase class C family)
VITLADLATHTSGLPLFPPIPGNPLDALAHYNASYLRSWLSGLTLSRDPGARWEYSNVGYCILGLALANKAGTTYDALLNRRIIGPIRLKDTTLHPTGEAIRRLAAGHDPKLAPVPPLDIGIFAPAGALRSTVDDLLSFISAVLPNSGSPLEAPAQLLLSIRRPAPMIGGEQAVGWDVVTGTEPFVVKDGVTAGQAASMVLDASKHIGVVVLSNALPVKMKAAPDGGVGAADLARHLIRPALPLG